MIEKVQVPPQDPNEQAEEKKKKGKKKCLLSKFIGKSGRCRQKMDRDAQASAVRTSCAYRLPLTEGCAACNADLSDYLPMSEM